MYYRFVGPYGSQLHERDATDFSEEVHDFFAEARAGVPQDEKQKARLHALLRLDTWYRQLACVAIADPLVPPGEQNNSALIEEFRTALLEFPDVTPQMLTPRVFSEETMQTMRSTNATLQELIRNPPPPRPTDEFMFRAMEIVLDSFDGKCFITRISRIQKLMQSAPPFPGPVRQRIVRPGTELSPEAEATIAGMKKEFDKAIKDLKDAVASKARREADEAAKVTAKANLEAALNAAKKDKDAGERALDEANTTITRLTNELEQIGNGMSSVERGIEDLSLEKTEM